VTQRQITRITSIFVLIAPKGLTNATGNIARRLTLIWWADKEKGSGGNTNQRARKMAKKSPYTTNTQIRSALRRLFLRSREHGQALKNAGYCCEICGQKQSRAKGKEVYVQVHHKAEGGVNWDGLFDEIRKRLLHKPEGYKVLCKECHKKNHKKGV